jgi:hypothetical protein
MEVPFFLERISNLVFGFPAGKRIYYPEQDPDVGRNHSSGAARSSPGRTLPLLAERRPRSLAKKRPYLRLEAGAAGDPGLLDENVLLGPEADLRRA